MEIIGHQAESFELYYLTRLGRARSRAPTEGLKPTVLMITLHRLMISSPMLGIMSSLCPSSRRRSTVPRPLISDESCMQSLRDISTPNYHRDRTRYRYATYEIAPAEYSSFGICGTPRPSTTGEISKAARTEATVIHIDERAMNRPGHIRRPNPKPTSGGFTLRSRKRSG
jgi:hypothetical protein